MRRRFYPVFGATMTLVAGCAIAAWAFFSTTAPANQLVTSSTLGAPTLASAVAAGSNTVTVTVATGPTAPAATGYVAYPHGSVTTPACTISSAAGSCTVIGVTPGTTTSYDLYSTLASWASSTSATVSATTPPARPSSVTLAGSGVGSAYVDAGNKSAVEIDVVLPATSTSADTVHLTITDGTTTITPIVKPGPAGLGTVAFPAVNLSALLDGQLTMTAWSSDAGGASTSLTAASIKDTGSPAPTVAAPLNAGYVASATPAIAGAAGTQAGDPGHSADATSVTVTVYAGASATGTPLQTLTGTVRAGTWSVAPTALTGNAQYTAQVSQSDAAGNAGTATTSFVIDTQPPAVAVSAPTAGATTTLSPTFTGTAGNQSATTTHGADSATVTVKVYAGATATGTPAQTLATTQTSGAWSVSANGLTGGQYTAVASQSDAAGNLGTSSAVTFTAAPIPITGLAFVNVGGLYPAVVTGSVQLVGPQGQVVANNTGAPILVLVSGGLGGGTFTVHIDPGNTTSNRFNLLLPIGNTLYASATVNGQVIHT